MERIDRLETLLIRDLRVLVTLAERKHFARAAEEFGISQPSLSAIVKKIETAFGVQIFARTSRRFAITPDGEAILRQTRTVLEEMARLAAMPDTNALPLIGNFGLGIIPTLGPYYLPHILAPLCQSFPALSLALVETKTETLIHQLRQRELDAALMAVPADAPDMEEYPLFWEDFMLAVPDGHPLYNGEAIRVQALDVREMLVLERGNCLRDQVVSACGTNHPGEVKSIHATSLETLRYMVAIRMGVTLFPTLATLQVSSLVPRVRYVRFSPPIPGRTIALVTRRNNAQIRDVRALADFLRSHRPELVLPL